MRSSVFVSFLVLSLFQTPSIADKLSYIVYLGAHSHGLNPSSSDLEFATNSHYHFLSSCLGNKEKAEDAIFYSYNRHINGFAAFLDEEEAVDIAKHPEVISVFLNKGRKLHTTHSWNFLAMEGDGGIPYSNSIFEMARFGEDTIIGNLDTGVWPESKSFSDEGIGPIPSRWNGTCQKEDNVRCNRKLIGARYFNKGYAAYAGKLITALSTVRDYEGHGSHTLSTAGGNFVSGASVFGFGNGTAKGGSPKARVAAYKVCWPPIDGGECFDADILAGFEAAISDGVDVLSVSLGGIPADFFEDGISIGSFHAVKNGIVVVGSAGNSGPVSGSVSNLSPWLLTVGASTTDREFINYVALGNKKHIKGASLSSKILPSQKFYPLIRAVDAKAANASDADALICKEGSLDPKKVRGRILVCLRGVTGRADKGYQAARNGAVGMILANDEASGNEVISDPHVLPASHITFTDGESVFKYINSTKTPMAYMTHVRTSLDIKPAPYMASFSSRGPNMIEPSILKPDITAPGVSIIAAFSEAEGAAGTFDRRRTPYNSQSGTSMSCPHVSGIVGLLKTLHPNWSPSAIKSAIMTSASTRDEEKRPIPDSSQQKATPFAYGSGHVRPNRAMDPGLVYDSTVRDYLNFLCSRGYNQTMIRLFTKTPYNCPKLFSLTDFNYPSISVPDLSSGAVTITRRVKNVGTPGTYIARVKTPRGVTVSVKPKTLKFDKVGEEKQFKVVLKSKLRKVGMVVDDNYVFGRLTWSDGKHFVRSPIAVNLV